MVKTLASSLPIHTLQQQQPSQASVTPKPQNINLGSATALRPVSCSSRWLYLLFFSVMRVKHHSIFGKTPMVAIKCIFTNVNFLQVRSKPSIIIFNLLKPSFNLSSSGANDPSSEHRHHAGLHQHQQQQQRGQQRQQFQLPAS